MAIGEELWLILRAKDESRAVLKEAEVNTSSLGSALGTTLKAGAVAAGAAALAAAGSIFEMANRSADAAMEVRKLERETGFSAEAVSELRYAGERLGIDTDQLSKSFGLLSKNLEVHQDKMRELGVETVLDAKGNVDLTATLGAMADRFKDMPDGTQKTALALEIFGKSGKDMLPLLNQGSEGLKTMGEEAHKVGLVFSQEGVNSAFKYKQAQKDLEDQFKALSMSVGVAVLPILTDLFGFLSKAASEILPKVGAGLKVLSDIVADAVVLGNFDKINDIMRSIFGKDVTDMIDQVAATVKKAAEVAIPAIKEALSEAKDVLANVIDDLGKFVGWLRDGSPPAEIFKGAILGVAAAFAVWKGVQIVGAVAEFVTLLPTMIGLLGLQAAATWAALAPLLLMAAPIIAITAAVYLAVTHWDDLVAVWQSVVYAGGQLVELIKTKFGELLGFFADLPERMGGFARDMVQGLIDGILGGIGAAKDAIGNLAGGMLDGVKDFFGIHSPSAVMAGIGKSIVEGLAGGVTANAGVAHAALGALVGGLTQSAAAGGAAVAKAFDQALGYGINAAGQRFTTEARPVLLAEFVKKYGLGNGSNAGDFVLPPGQTLASYGASIEASRAADAAWFAAHPGRSLRLIDDADPLQGAGFVGGVRNTAREAMLAGIPHFDEGGIMPWTGIAHLERGERVTKPGEASVHVEVHVGGSVIGITDLEQRVVQAVRDGILRGGFRGVLRGVS